MVVEDMIIEEDMAKLEVDLNCWTETSMTLSFFSLGANNPNIAKKVANIPIANRILSPTVNNMLFITRPVPHPFSVILSYRSQSKLHRIQIQKYLPGWYRRRSFGKD